MIANPKMQSALRPLASGIKMTILLLVPPATSATSCKAQASDTT